MTSNPSEYARLMKAAKSLSTRRYHLARQLGCAAEETERKLHE